MAPATSHVANPASNNNERAVRVYQYRPTVNASHPAAELRPIINEWVSGGFLLLDVFGDKHSFGKFY